MYTEDTANVGAKRAIQSAGGGTLALAIAMEEDKHLDAHPHSDYPFRVRERFALSAVDRLQPILNPGRVFNQIVISATDFL